MIKLKALTAQDCEEIQRVAGFLRQHAKAIFEMPASEQMIGARDAVLHAALNQIADVFDRIAK